MSKIFAYFRTGDQVAEGRAASLLTEGRTYDLGKGWSVRFDRAHVTGMQDHSHIEFRGDQISVINRDGSPSHNTTRNRVPQSVVDFLIDKKLIKESRDICESTEGMARDVIDAALQRERSDRLIAQAVEYMSRLFRGGRH
jgi:hypothetical protein